MEKILKNYLSSLKLFLKKFKVKILTFFLTSIFKKKFDEEDFLEETEWPLNHRKFMPYISTMEVGTSASNNEIVLTQDRTSTS